MYSLQGAFFKVNSVARRDSIISLAVSYEVLYIFGFMRSRYSRGTNLTSRQLNQLLPGVLARIGRIYQSRPDLILSAWPSVIGANLAAQTRATSFSEGVLFVSVKNSTLYSLLTQHDKPRIIQSLREKFPHTTIKTIVFRLE